MKIIVESYNLQKRSKKAYLHNTESEHLTSSVCEVTTKEVPSFREEGPGSDDWDTPQVVDISVFLGAQDICRAQDNSEGAYRNGADVGFNAPFRRIWEKASDRAKGGLQCGH